MVHHYIWYLNWEHASSLSLLSMRRSTGTVQHFGRFCVLYLGNVQVHLVPVEVGVVGRRHRQVHPERRPVQHLREFISSTSHEKKQRGVSTTKGYSIWIGKDCLIDTHVAAENQNLKSVWRREQEMGQYSPVHHLRTNGLHRENIEQSSRGTEGNPARAFQRGEAGG